MRDLRLLLWRPSPDWFGIQSDRPCGECKLPTEGQKPYCAKHVERNAYAALVLHRIEERVLADARVAEHGAIAGHLEDMTCREILACLRLRGVLNFDRIVRDLDLDREAAWGYVTLLQIFRLVERHRSRETGVWRVEIKLEVVVEEGPGGT